MCKQYLYKVYLIPWYPITGDGLMAILCKFLFTQKILDYLPYIQKYIVFNNTTYLYCYMYIRNFPRLLIYKATYLFLKI